MTTPTNPKNIEKGSLPTPVIQNPEGLSRKEDLQNSLRRHWGNFKARIGTSAALSSDSNAGELDEVNEEYELHLLDASSIDETIVDRKWADSVLLEYGGLNGKSGESHPRHALGDTDQLTGSPVSSFWDSLAFLAMWRRRAWPAITKMKIFSLRFEDEKAERDFCQESWYLKKKLALWSALWLIVNWVLGCIFVFMHRNLSSRIDYIFYFICAPVLSLPVVFMVMYDWPRTRPYMYQSFLVVSIWSWAFSQIITIMSCGYYTATPDCQGMDFLGTLYYAMAPQTIALFGLRLNRFPAALAALTFFLFTLIGVAPQRPSWARNMVNYLMFQAFLIYVHHVSESSERRLYNLRNQLKVQSLFQAAQKAQLEERRAWASRRQLASCVRVPLDTALHTVQNMEVSGSIGKEQQIQSDALRGSLSMMSKLLDDAVNFDHIDNSKFELVNDPYAFHDVIKSFFASFELTTKARNLTFESELDPNIDILARQASYRAMGAHSEVMLRYIKEHPNVSGIVLGDEVRLRQIITNLASNACKFTPPGGKVIIRTRLVIPSLPAGFDPLCDVCNTSDSYTFDITKVTKPDQAELECQVEDVEAHTQPLSHRYLTLHSIKNGSTPQEVSETLVVRIEVEDTGCGVKARDIYVGKPFWNSNQIERGTQQGRIGSGLGLALVQQLVKLSGGRLGVRAKEGQGSKFWVELPVGIGKKTFLTDLPNTSGESSASLSQRNSLTYRPKNTSWDLTTSGEARTQGLSLRKVPPNDAQTFAAVQGLVEQEQGKRMDSVYEHSIVRNSDVALLSTKC